MSENWAIANGGAGAACRDTRLRGSFAHYERDCSSKATVVRKRLPGTLVAQMTAMFPSGRLLGSGITWDVQWHGRLHDQFCAVTYAQFLEDRM